MRSLLTSLTTTMVQEAATRSLSTSQHIQAASLKSYDGYKNSIVPSENYENAIKSLNSLQSNFSVISNSVARVHNSASIHIKETIKFLSRVGITLDTLDALPVIHVSGTKGKGSTCSLVESILRAHGYRTGFFSSPHLVSVTERIRLDGKPICKNAFSMYFWHVYNNLVLKQDDPKDLPAYFNFLTVMAFEVFLRENVDVAIIEVGIGGEYDCTNVLRNTKTVGITSLGFEHTKLLGNTLEEIAWQKSGIIKEMSNVFTVSQPEECLKVIREKCEEKNSCFHIVPDFESYNWERFPHLKTNIPAQKMNTSLAISLALDFMSSKKNKLEHGKPLPKPFTVGIESCFWPGRCQKVEVGNKRLFLDGAHTVESIEICGDWFSECVKNDNPKILLFNTTGDRDSKVLLKILHDKLVFDVAIFVPNISTNISDKDDTMNHNFPNDEQTKRCEENCQIWKLLSGTSNTHAFTSVENAVQYLDNNYVSNQDIDILITGSLHLIGAVLKSLKLEDIIS